MMNMSHDHPTHETRTSPAIAILAAWLDAEMYMRCGDTSCRHSVRLLGHKPVKLSAAAQNPSTSVCPDAAHGDVAGECVAADHFRQKLTTRATKPGLVAGLPDSISAACSAVEPQLTLQKPVAPSCLPRETEMGDV